MASTIVSYKEHHVPVPESPVIGVGYMFRPLDIAL